MRQVMEHFGHRYRVHGNMLCPWHEERNPSARLYDKDDSFWCWVCWPGHGVDIVEFVVIEQGLEEELGSRPRAIIAAVTYLEENFGISYQAQPWEIRLDVALHPHRALIDPKRYWSDRHEIFLRELVRLPSVQKWSVYKTYFPELLSVRNQPIEIQASLWSRATSELTAID